MDQPSCSALTHLCVPLSQPTQALGWPVSVAGSISCQVLCCHRKPENGPLGAF